MQPIAISRYIDDPPHFLLWQADELAPPMLGLMAGVVSDNVVLLTCLGLCCNYFYRRFRDNHPNGFIVHYAYSRLGVSLKGHCFPNPFIREYF
ncbi:MAG: type IV conjugative transfer system protein TraL [Succinivibrionaceae bacterium]|nr:type IV conjugative transfer system protein TraL [Succinivibrionaceae bacterium]